MDEEEKFRIEMEQTIQRARAGLEESVNHMVASMMANMTPAIAIAQAVERESAAWDAFAASKRDLPAEEAAAYADEMLEERRKRFSPEKMRARIEELMHAQPEVDATFRRGG